MTNNTKLDVSSANDYWKGTREDLKEMGKNIKLETYDNNERTKRN